MKPKRFRYTENVPGAPSDQEFYGLIAQEAARIDPNLVHRFKVPSPDNLPQPDPTYLGVDSQRLVFTLISAVKALDEKDREIDALRARVEALETQAKAKQPSPFQRVAQAMSRLLPPAPSDRVSATRWNAASDDGRSATWWNAASDDGRSTARIHGTARYLTVKNFSKNFFL